MKKKKIWQLQYNTCVSTMYVLIMCTELHYSNSVLADIKETSKSVKDHLWNGEEVTWQNALLSWLDNQLGV